MIIGITGSPGAGKSLTLSALTLYIDLACMHMVPVWANYSLINSKRFTKWQEIKEVTGAIIAWDEIHMSMDSRAFKDTNSQIYTAWLSILRHFSTVLIYTTQSMDQIDKRLRNLTDYVWQCTDQGENIKIQSIDWQTWRLGRTFVLGPKQQFYKFYDSYEIIKPIQMPKAPDQRFKENRKKNG